MNILTKSKQGNKIFRSRNKIEQTERMFHYKLLRAFGFNSYYSKRVRDWRDSKILIVISRCYINGGDNGNKKRAV